MKRRRKSEAGFAMLLVFILAVMLAIAIFSALPQFFFEAQRDREQLLIDRGEQYSMAVRRFYTRTGRYPSSFDELDNVQGMRFLRHRYKDPMTSSGEWRIVHTNGMGIMTDSHFATVPGIGGALPQANSFGTMQAVGTSDSSTRAIAGEGGTTNSSDPQQQPAWARRIRATPPAPTTGNTPDGNGEQEQAAESADANHQIHEDLPNQAGVNAAARKLRNGAGNAQAGTGQAPTGSAPGDGLPGGGGGFIAGVASESTEEAIKVYRGQTNYGDWEFTFDARLFIRNGQPQNGPPLQNGSPGLAPGAQPAPGSPPQTGAQGSGQNP